LLFERPARRTRLVRVPDLAGLRQGLVEQADRADTFILVPSGGAVRQLSQTLQRASGQVSRPDADLSAHRLARIGTRSDLYAELAARLPGLPRLIGAHDREVVAAAIAREIEAAGIRPPFQVRPALMAEIVALYDHVRRQGRTVADFERNIAGELEAAAETDRGAARLLEQTRFLAALFRRYEERLASAGEHDEHLLREALMERAAPAPVRRVVVTMADRTADPDGLWPVDFLLLARVPGLEELDVFATEAMLSAGWLERLHAVLPGLVEVQGTSGRAGLPVLVIPRTEGSTPAGPLVHYSRDREEELAQVARRIKAERRAGRMIDPDRIALVVRRPLPYLYLAGETLGAAGIPFEALDALPLAAEPYAAALDLVLDAAATGFSRVSLTALLASPHFAFGIDRAEVSALGRALAAARYASGLDRLEALAAAWSAIAVPANRDERRQAEASRAAGVASPPASFSTFSCCARSSTGTMPESTCQPVTRPTNVAVW
jgi:hypothetical protein